MPRMPRRKERRADAGQRDRIAWLQHVWERTARLLWRAMAILYIAGAIGGFFLWKAYTGVQDSRFQATFDACREANVRHDKTVAAFRVEFQEQIKRDPPANKRELLARQANRDANIRLINVFVPVHKDKRGRSTCRAFARQAVKTDGPTLP